MSATGSAASGTTVRAEEFDGPLDTSLWTFIDPLGDSTFAIQDGVASVSVPGGVVHAIWNTTNTAPRLLQGVPDVDLEVEVKFDLPVRVAFQIQGIVVESDDGRLIRAETHYHDSGVTNLFAASTEDGVSTARGMNGVDVAPTALVSYLRLTRVGDEWTLSHSSDGQTWSSGLRFMFELPVKRIGLFTGNEGSPPPAFVSAIDSFHLRLADPPVETAPRTPQPAHRYRRAHLPPQRRSRRHRSSKAHLSRKHRPVPGP